MGERAQQSRRRSEFHFLRKSSRVFRLDMRKIQDLIKGSDPRGGGVSFEQISVQKQVVFVQRCRVQ